MAPHSSTLAWKIPWTEEPGRLQSMGSLRVGHDWATSLSLFTFMHWRRKWQPTPVLLPGESQRWWSLVGCHLWVAFLSRSMHLLIAWHQSPSAVILEPKKIKSVTASVFTPSICHEVILDAMILVFGMFSFRLVFSLSSFSLIKRCLSPSSLLSWWLSSAYLEFFDIYPACFDATL